MTSLQNSKPSRSSSATNGSFLSSWPSGTSCPNSSLCSKSSTRNRISPVSWQCFLSSSSSLVRRISNFSMNSCAMTRICPFWGHYNVDLSINLDDPNFKNNRPKHREFMRNKSRLLEVVPFSKSGEMLNLIIFTYRLEYVKECVLLPYLNDYAFTCTNYVQSKFIKIIKGNYRKILNQIFNQKKKDFINNLFDLLRIQDVNAFKLLREIFRIGKTIYVTLSQYLG